MDDSDSNRVAKTIFIIIAFFSMVGLLFLRVTFTPRATLFLGHDGRYPRPDTVRSGRSSRCWCGQDILHLSRLLNWLGRRKLYGYSTTKLWCLKIENKSCSFALVGLILDRLVHLRQLFLFSFLLAIAISTAATPFAPNLWVICALALVQGLGSGALDTGKTHVA